MKVSINKKKDVMDYVERIEYVEALDALDALVLDVRVPSHGDVDDVQKLFEVGAPWSVELQEDGKKVGDPGEGDVIEVRMDLAGLPVTLLDTAGLRETDDHVEGIGIRLAQERAERADIRVFLAEEDESFSIQMREGDLRLLPKADERRSAKGAISGRTGQGVDDLVSRISDTLRNRTAHDGIATRARHRETMNRAVLSLRQAIEVVEQGPEFYDLAAEDMRSAIRALELLVGRINVENLLDEIFSSFCLGK